MGDFFHGWRRKTGFTTLFAAFLFLSGWVHSLNSQDVVDYEGNSIFLTMASANGKLIGVWYPQPEMFDRPRWEIGDFGWWSDEILPSGNAIDDELDKTINVSGDWAGTSLRCAIDDNPSDGGLWIVFIPYGMIVIPLTLLSAWLILITPRRTRSVYDPK